MVAYIGGVQELNVQVMHNAGALGWVVSLLLLKVNHAVSM